ncbi:MAG: double-strand break repair protein AddB [Sphingomonadaceae bacterium]
MAERRQPAIFSIPLHRAFADALVAGLLAQSGADPLGLARGLILVPNNRASAAITAAFVRQASKGLLLPRFVAIGDADINDAAGLAFDGAGDNPVPPAIDPLHRQLILARLVQESDPSIDASQAIRLAADVARTIDQLIVEEVDPATLAGAQREELASHWQRSFALLTQISARWSEELARLGRIDLADRRNRLLARTARVWTEQPPPHFVVAAGISTAAPAIARLLSVVAHLPRGQIVFAGLDTAMPDDEWAEVTGNDATPALESHPQFHLAQLLARIDVSRADVRLWRWGSEIDARAARSRALSNAMAPANFTVKWATLDIKDRSLAGVHMLELAGPAEEAQTIALALRERIEVPGQTAALVTPDRALATRVSAHLQRWGIDADDSAGQRLSVTPPGTLILAMAEAAAARFAPVPLLALLKHLLVQTGDARMAWLDNARALDIAVRGPRPAEGLSGITAFLSKGDEREMKARLPVLPWWRDVAEILAPLESIPTELSNAIGVLRDVLGALAGESVWRGISGRAAASLFEALEHKGDQGPTKITGRDLPIILRTLMDSIVVRDVNQGHPRISIWGLLEAKLQSANLMILAGLNEGVWPALPAPDPWLAPRIRRELKLPSLERRIGLAAHDLAGAMGAQDVLITRAKRDASAPTIASRFWLRIEAMTGGLGGPRARFDDWARAIDTATAPPTFSKRPAPQPPASDRPRRVSVTEVDGLKADPFAFYARKMLALSSLDPVDAEPSAAWRGSLIHRVLDEWAKRHDYAPGALLPALAHTFADEAIHPLLCALWLPRLEQAAEWIVSQVTANRAAGRAPLVSECDGKIDFDGITLHGRVDRIDKGPSGLAIIDYKSGEAPSNRQVAAGYKNQLGLLGLIADRGGFPGVTGRSSEFEYWALSRNDKQGFGKVKSPTGKGGVAPDDFVSQASAHFRAVIDLWLIGDEPFTAKRHPDYAFADYDHLMRLDEWMGR